MKKLILLFGLIAFTAFSQTNQLQRIPPDVAYHGPNGYIPNAGVVSVYQATITQIKPNFLVVRIRCTSDKMDDDQWHNRVIIIRNHPKWDQFATGDILKPCLCSFIGIKSHTTSNRAELRIREYNYLKETN